MSHGLAGQHADPQRALRMRAQQVRTVPPEPGEAVLSPCVSVCRLDASLQRCEGCLRSLDEIRLWPSMTNSERLALWRRIEARLDAQQQTSAP